MLRRRFIANLLATSGGLLSPNPSSAHWGLLAQGPTTPDTSIQRVLVIFKCHFDAGFIDTQANVVRRYFDEFFPKAIETAASLSHAGSPGYVWTTGSWLLYEYLEQASSEQRKKMEEAIQAGYIAWHALPFTWQTELMDPTLISGAIGISQSLDRRFGTKTTGAKMTDVPGHTRGLISPLAANGITFLDIGVNEASRPAILPSLFRWTDPSGASLAVMYHSGYGAVTVIPGAALVVAIVVRDDNAGPHTPEEIQKTHAVLQARFPNAEIVPTNLSTVANEIAPHVNALPAVAQEIGDTWIHGVGSDPLKVARYREVCRMRRQWIREGNWQVGSDADVQLLRNLLLEVEHTWGTDTKTWLDFDHYTPKDLEPMLETKNYRVVESSWQEKRRDLYTGLDTLPADRKGEVTSALASLVPHPPAALTQEHNASREIETPHFLLKLDEKTGAIVKLQQKSSGRNWASPDHPLALFSYQTLSQADYASFFAAYVISNQDWAKKDFGKPNIERFGAESRIWNPTIAQITSGEDEQAHHLLARLEIKDTQALASGRAAFPKQIFVEYVLPKSRPAIEITLSCFQKSPTRMPEALWFSFHPVVTPAGRWSMQKSGQEVSPSDVVECGNRHLHALLDSIAYKDSGSALSFTTLDAPLVAIGRPSPLNFSRNQPDFDSGIHFNLFNNAWGTNYILWYAEDMRFRFVIEA
jgi:Domain of unknown function (DUF5054)